jgi:hypothetical protein
VASTVLGVADSEGGITLLEWQGDVVSLSIL